VEVRASQYGNNLIPLHEYEDDAWLGSCKVATQGRSPAYVYLFIDPLTGQICFVKVDTHKQRCVKCLDSHFGEDAKCIQSVRDDWNDSHSDEPAGFGSVTYRRDFECDEDQFPYEYWPQRDPKNPIIKTLAEDLALRSRAGERAFFASSACHMLHCVPFSTFL